MVQSNRSNSNWHNDIITWLSWLVIFVSAANELAAQHSFTWLVLAVAIAACFRNPPTSPAPPVQICYGVIHVIYKWGLFIYVICAAAVFLTCLQQHVVDVLARASLGTCVADLFRQDQTHIQWGKKNIWSPADFVRLPTDKEMISL